MKKILMSIAMVALLGGAIVGGTGAFFSDAEISSGNTFAAGAIDLLIDNESYYNGNKCAVDANDLDQDQNVTEYLWHGEAAYPVPGTPCDTSFPRGNLDEGLLFFNFDDLKPDDEGEDTISIHVQNDAWACMDLSLTSDDDISSTEPELEGTGDVQNTDDAWDGELGGVLEFIWWADDGDNVLEDDEQLLTDGVQSLTELASTTPWSVALADATHNVWGEENGTPLPANDTLYIAKAWCFGDLAAAPIPAGQGVNPSVATGVNCEGTLLGNEYQTDGVTLDVAFRAIQARHNPDFLCNEGEVRPQEITVTKTVINDDGGNNVIGDFQLFLNGVMDVPLSSGVPANVNPGVYTVAELGAQGYEATFGGDCDSDGNITIVEGGGPYSCTITNDDIPSSVTLIKNVVGGSAVATDFSMRVNGTLVPSGGSKPVDSNTNVTITEDAFPGYTATGITGSGCPANLGDVFQLNEGVAIVCTVTNTAN